MCIGMLILNNFYIEPDEGSLKGEAFWETPTSQNFVYCKRNLKLLIFLKISQSFGVKIIVMQHPKTNFQNQFSSFGQTDLGLPNIKIFAKI